MSVRLQLALSRALLGAVALPAVFTLAAPLIAVAQVPAQPDRSVFAIRFLGEWVDDYGLKYLFTDAGAGRLNGVVTRIATGEVVATLDWGPRSDAMGGNFRVPGQNPNDPASDRGITGYVNHQGQAALFVRSGRFPNGHQSPAHPDRGPGARSHDFILRRPQGLEAANLSNWQGEWRTSRGLMEIRNDGQGLFAAVRSGEPLTATARVALRGDTSGIATGAWEKEGEWSPSVDRGDVWLQLSNDGNSFRGYYTDLNRTGAQRIDWTGERSRRIEPAPLDQATPDQQALIQLMVGRWQNPSGTIQWNFQSAGRGRLSATTWDTGQDEQRDGTRMEFQPMADGRQLLGRPSERRRFTLERDANGRFQMLVQHGERPASRTQLVRVEDQPAPVPQDPRAPSAPAGPTPAPDQLPSTRAGEQTSAFQPLRQFDVRLDRVMEARGYPTRQVHVFVTIRNASGRAQYITSGFLKALLSDADGVAQERNQVWRAGGEPAALFNSTPVVQPGGELRIRYVFTPDNGSRPASFSLMEGDRRAEFSVTGF